APIVLPVPMRRRYPFILDASREGPCEVFAFVGLLEMADRVAGATREFREQTARKAAPHLVGLAGDLVLQRTLGMLAQLLGPREADVAQPLIALGQHRR